MKPQRVVDVQPADGYVLKLTFADGCKFDLDFWPMIADATDPLNAALHDLAEFRRVALNGLTIEWPNGLDICPDGLRQWCEAGSILPEDAVTLQR